MDFGDYAISGTKYLLSTAIISDTLFIIQQNEINCS